MGYNAHMNVGDIGTVTSLDENSSSINVRASDEYIGYHDKENMRLVQNGKVVKPELHVVLIDACENFDGVFHSEEAGLDKLKEADTSKTLYKLVPVAQTEYKATINMLKSKAGRPKKKVGRPRKA